MIKEDFTMWTKEDFLKQYSDECPSTFGFKSNLESECGGFDESKKTCERCWEMALENVEFKSKTKLEEVDVSDVINDWLDEMRNAEGHCLFCKLEQEKSGYTFIDFLKENNIKMYTKKEK